MNNLRSGILSIKGARYDSVEVGKERLGNGKKFDEFNIDATSQTNRGYLQPKEQASYVTPSILALKGIEDSLKSHVEKYWKQPPVIGSDDIVVIHVCDENRQITKDFCCKRNILIKHMKYFEKFLSENENGYDDIDISVHCDVEIFEWLMTYIHEPEKPPILDKAVVISILISSEFLQMDTLVELCLEHIAASLSEIIKLPIDLSCISEKLINKLAFLTHPKTLAQTRDRKDKILNKLYKRRVELDFSRKTGSRGGGSVRTIAASLACCKYCGCIYLATAMSLLACRCSPPSIDFRGGLSRRHYPISGWSLTSYLKTLHAGGMGWDAIYWHVWAACEVFKVGKDVMISALEVDRYTLESDGLLIRRRQQLETQDASMRAVEAARDSPHFFNLFSQDDQLQSDAAPCKITVSSLPESLQTTHSHVTSTLNPARPPDILTLEIFNLICSQMKYIAGLSNKKLIEVTCAANVSSARCGDDGQPLDLADLLWAEQEDVDAREEEGRGRSHSPVRGKETRKQTLSLVVKTRNETDIQADDSERRARSSSTSKYLRGSTQASATSSLPNSVRVQRKGGDAATERGEREKEDREKDDRDRDSECGDLAADSTASSIFKAMTPEVARLCAGSRAAGPVMGLWLVTHPLVLHPSHYSDMTQTVQDSGLSDNKKLEWQLDLLREYDEKRMDKFESLLVSRRSMSPDVQLLPANRDFKQRTLAKRRGQSSVDNFLDDSQCLAGLSGSYFSIKGSGEYYRDKGRQPNKLPL